MITLYVVVSILYTYMSRPTCDVYLTNDHCATLVTLSGSVILNTVSADTLSVYIPYCHSVTLNIIVEYGGIIVRFYYATGTCHVELKTVIFRN